DFTRFSTSDVPDSPSPYCREGRATILLENNRGSITPDLMMEFLRDHSGGICMHGGFRSTASLVSKVTSEFAVHWVMGTPNPCLGMFKPIFIPATYAPPYFMPGSFTHNSAELWNRYEKALNKVGQKELYSKLSDLEKKFYKEVEVFLSSSKFDEEKAKSISKNAFTAEWNLLQNIIK
ncbi:MAG: hypothetical protein ACFFCM_02365, partial [Promethearchaeota archaeon]